MLSAAHDSCRRPSYAPTPHRWAATSAESLPASTRIGLSRGASHSRVAGPRLPKAIAYSRPAPFLGNHLPPLPLELGPRRLWPSLRMSCPLPSPQSPPALDLLAPSTALPRLSNTPAPGEAEHAGEKYIYISKNTCIHAPEPSPTGSECKNPPGA
jgi:hypothetical protein